MSLINKSMVWLHYTKINDSSAKCSHCGKIIKCSGGSTSSLKKHLDKQHTLIRVSESTSSNVASNEVCDDDTESERVVKKQRSVLEMYTDTTTPRASTSSTVIEGVVNSAVSDATEDSGSASEIQSTPSYQPKIFEHYIPTKTTNKKNEQITQHICHMIAVDMLPFSFTENTGFRKLMNYVAPYYTVPSRSTIQRRIEMQYNNLKSNVIKELTKYNYVALTTDCWTSIATVSFMTVTCHTIDDEWETKCYTLSTKELVERHTAIHLTDKLQEVINEFSLNNKVIAVVHDNAANICSAIRSNKDLFGESVRCHAHTLQLSLNAALNCSEPIQTLTKTCSTVVSHFNHSTVAAQALKLRQTQLALPDHKLIQRNNTRWNSTFYMFQRILEQKTAIIAVLGDRTVTSAKMSTIMNDMNWVVLEQLIDILSPFEKITKLYSAQKVVTLSTVKPLLYSIRQKYLTISHENTLFYEAEVNKFRKLLFDDITERFFADIDLSKISMFDSATILDPRYKNEIRNQLKEYAHSHLDKLLQQFYVDVQPGQFENEDINDEDDFLNSLFPQEMNQANSKQMEIKNYLAAIPIYKKSSVLGWWRLNNKSFPKIAKLAQIYLMIPATSTPSERVFSTAGNIVSAKRNCLGSKNVDMLVFLYENLK